MADDVLGLLLPGASAEARASVRRVVMALRLLRDDARFREPRRVEPSWSSARHELERMERRQRRRAIEALLHAYLSALRPADSFLDLGSPPLDCAAAWRTLLAEPTPIPGVPPGPLQTPLSVIERLLEIGGAHGAPTSWRALWAASAKHVAAPPAEAERHWESALRASLAAGDSPLVHARLVAGLAAARLDRFEPARALELLGPHAALVGLHPALRRLLGWSALLCGKLAPARLLLGHDTEPAVRVPSSLVELRTDVPEWADLLQGSEATGSSTREECLPADRSEFGAILLGVFEIDPDGGSRILALDAPRGLKGEAERMLASSPGSGPRPRSGEVERLRVRGNAPSELPVALAGDRTRAVALTGLADRWGHPRGWIQLESEHQLLPCVPRLTAMARAWSRTLEARPERVTIVARGDVAPRPRPFDALDPRGEFVRRLFERLELRSGRGACWVERDEHGLELIRARRGTSPATEALSHDSAAALRDASTRLEPVRYAVRVSSIAPSTRTIAGVAIPLTDSCGRRVLGLLALEGERERLTEAYIASARESLRTLEPLWWATSFRADRLARTGDDLAWDPARRFLAELEPALRVAADSRAAILLAGSPGSGRRTLAHWLHFRGPAPERALIEGPGNPQAGTRLLEIEGLEHAAQIDVARRMAEGSPERILLLGQAPAHVLRERGVLSAELERRMDPLPLAVPPLCERRDEIPALVSVLAANAARRTSVRPLRIRDDAMAHLWRQEWRGGVAELASLVAQLVHAHGGRVVGALEVRAAFRARRLEFRERLPSQRPRALDLELALECTRHRVGSENRARAARYLGWDPETLEARLRELAPSLRAGVRKKREASSVSLDDASVPPDPRPWGFDPLTTAPRVQPGVEGSGSSPRPMRQ